MQSFNGLFEKLLYHCLKISRNMRVILFLCCCLVGLGITAQRDTLCYPIVNASLETGIVFRNSDSIVQSFQVKNTLNIGFNLTCGYSKWRLLPYFGWNYYRFKGDTIKFPKTLSKDETFEFKKLTRTQLFLGLTAPVKLNQSSYINLGFAPILNMQCNNIDGTDSASIGLSMHLSFVKRLSYASDFFIKTNYEYSQFGYGGRFKNANAMSVNIGFSLNLAILDEVEKQKFKQF